MEITDITTPDAPAEAGADLALNDRAALALNSTKTEADLREMAAKYTHITAGGLRYTGIFRSTMDAVLDAMERFPGAGRISVMVAK